MTTILRVVNGVDETQLGSSEYQSRIESMCACGCGRPAIVNMETSARRLKACRQAAVGLVRLSNAGGRLGATADHLLWAWDRAEPALDALVHGWENESLLGVPTAMWTSIWRERAAKLQVQAAKRKTGTSRPNRLEAGSRMRA